MGHCAFELLPVVASTYLIICFQNLRCLMEDFAEFPAVVAALNSVCFLVTKLWLK